MAFTTDLLFVGSALGTGRAAFGGPSDGQRTGHWHGRALHDALVDLFSPCDERSGTLLMFVRMLFQLKRIFGGDRVLVREGNSSKLYYIYTGHVCTPDLFPRHFPQIITGEL